MDRYFTAPAATPHTTSLSLAAGFVARLPLPKSQPRIVQAVDDTNQTKPPRV